jgi:hypothetical protein
VSRRFVVRRQAELEISAALDWYELERPGLGVEFSVELDKTFRDIFAVPWLGLCGELGIPIGSDRWSAFRS